MLLRGFIPRLVPNRLVLFFYDLLAGHRRFGTIGAVRDAGPDRGTVPRMIEDQRARASEPFGRSTVAYAGCEVIALYNAMLYLCGREPVPFRELIRIFEKRGMVRHGLWGTSPLALMRFFDVCAPGGIRAAATADRKRFEEFARTYPCLIYSFYNDGRDIFRGVHTVCLTAGEGGFTAHNLTEDGRTHGPYPTLEALCADHQGGRMKGLYLLGLRKDP